MNKETLYKSSLAHHIEEFLDEKIALGYKYTAESRIMRRFDKYWAERGYEEIGLTADNIAEWIQKGNHEGVGQLKNRIIVVRQFSIYLNGLFIPSYIPPLNIRCEKPVSISAVEREFNAFWAKTSFAKSCNKKPTVHDLRHAYVVHRINLWLEQGLDFEHMLPYLSKFLGHRGFDETFYYYHYAEEAAHTIRKMDTVTNKVIPEVMRR